jgi:transcriptional regulator of arginine metabolism
MKAQRQAVILKLIRQHRVHSQEQLRELLVAAGMDVTQATLSRDMRELRLAKVADPDGGSRYEVPSQTDVPRPPLNQLLPALLLSLDGVGNLLVAKTPAGAASALTEALDTQDFAEIVGTIAGDNTILVVARSERARVALARRLRELAGLPA